MSFQFLNKPSVLYVVVLVDGVSFEIFFFISDQPNGPAYQGWQMLKIVFPMSPKIKANRERWPVPSRFKIKHQSNFFPNQSGERALDEQVVRRLSIIEAKMANIWSYPSFSLKDIPGVQLISGHEPSEKFNL
jgi:hypothetical protein